MAGIFSQGGSAGHRYAGWLETVEAKNFQFGGKVFNGSPSAIYVGSNLVWPWLTVAAQKAIRGAFGQRDGMAVINATHAYLNQLAASDRDKATALAGFINETPALAAYVSGWLEPDEDYPIKHDTNFATGYIAKNTTSVEIITYLAKAGDSSWKRIVSAGSWGTTNGMYLDTQNNTMTIVWNTSTNTYSWASSDIGKNFTISVSQSQWIVKQGGTTKKTASGSSWHGTEVSANGTSRWQWRILKIKEGNTEVHRFLALPDGYVLDQINKNLITPSTP